MSSAVGRVGRRRIQSAGRHPRTEEFGGNANDGSLVRKEAIDENGGSHASNSYITALNSAWGAFLQRNNGGMGDSRTHPHRTARHVINNVLDPTAVVHHRRPTNRQVFSFLTSSFTSNSRDIISQSCPHRHEENLKISIWESPPGLAGEMSSSPTDPLESYPVNDPYPDLEPPVEEDAPEHVSHCSGLRVVSIDSESDSDYLESEDPYSFDLGLEVVDGGGFEWEEVAESGDASNDVVEEVTALSSDYFTDDEEEDRWESGGGGGGARISAVRDLEWELLVAVNNVTGNLFFNNDLLYDIDGDAYYVEDSSDTLFDQFMDNVAEIKGSPPAAKEVVENLPVVVAEDGDSELCGGDCAVCKDEIGVGVRVRTLPCSHFYHEECILPWLEMRNTCPVCRYELPTDDADYERSKTGDGRGRPTSWDVRVNEEFELFV